MFTRKGKALQNKAHPPSTTRAFPHGDRRGDRQERLAHISSHSELAQVALARLGFCRQVGGAAGAGLNRNLNRSEQRPSGCFLPSSTRFTYKPRIDHGMLVRRAENGFAFAGPLECPALIQLGHAMSEEDIHTAVMAWSPRKEILQASPG